jgi:putative component of membrane protein insertase Oxa1/YidC/SpoIIIJ protein YidD
VRALLLAAIRGYKRHVSPYKGFSCPCRVHLGAPSCSTLGLRAISRFGAWRGLGVLRLRLEQCHLVAEEHRARRFIARSAQAGFADCDMPCDGSCVDASSCSECGACSVDSFELAACVDCSDVDECGCPRWRWPRRQATRPLRRRGDPTSGQAPPPGPLDEPPAGE